MHPLVRNELCSPVIPVVRHDMFVRQTTGIYCFSFYRWIMLFALLYVVAGMPDVCASPFIISDSIRVSFPDDVESRVTAMLDSMISTTPDGTPKARYNQSSPARNYQDESGDFYLLLFLVMIPGLVRLLYPRYFAGLWQMLKNPAASNRQLKDRMQAARLPNAVMNIFFVLSCSAYFYYLIRYVNPSLPAYIGTQLLVVLLIAGITLIYLVKFGTVMFSGWVFRMEQITGHYLFHVFFINKIISVALLPFTILLAFSGAEWGISTLIVSGLMLLLLFVSRYIRSWEVFGSFFQYSRFHFFLYLCASELLPLALLIKLLIRGLFMDQ